VNILIAYNYVDKRPVENMSFIFRTRTSSTIY